MLPECPLNKTIATVLGVVLQVGVEVNEIVVVDDLYGLA